MTAPTTGGKPAQNALGRRTLRTRLRHSPLPCMPAPGASPAAVARPARAKPAATAVAPARPTCRRNVHESAAKPPAAKLTRASTPVSAPARLTGQRIACALRPTQRGRLCGKLVRPTPAPASAPAPAFAAATCARPRTMHHSTATCRARPAQRPPLCYATRRAVRLPRPLAPPTAARTACAITPIYIPVLILIIIRVPSWRLRLPPAVRYDAQLPSSASRCPRTESEAPRRKRGCKLPATRQNSARRCRS
jgi:hypothetical protein